MLTDCQSPALCCRSSRSTVKESLNEMDQDRTRRSRRSRLQKVRQFRCQKGEGWRPRSVRMCVSGSFSGLL